MAPMSNQSHLRRRLPRFTPETLQANQALVELNEVLDLLLDAVRPAGVIVNVSIWGHPATVDMQKLVLKEIDLRGTIAYVRDHEAVIKLVQAGKIDLKPFITGRIALEDLVSEGFWTLIDHNDTAVKILVHP